MTDALQATVKVAEGGRIVIPAEVRHRLGMEIGSELLLRVEGDQATLTTAKAARQKARQAVRHYVQAHVSLSEELMAERKAEARRE